MNIYKYYLMDIPVERQCMRDLITIACGKNPTWDSLDCIKKQSFIRKIERSCYNNAIISCEHDGHDRSFTNNVFTSRYSSNCYKILANLDMESSVHSEYLINATMNGLIDLDTIAEYNSADLCPDASQKERDEIALRKQQKVEQKVSRQYTCRRCGKNETTQLEYMGRSADEAMKVSIKCINCDYTWRMN